MNDKNDEGKSSIIINHSSISLPKFKGVIGNEDINKKWFYC